VDPRAGLDDMKLKFLTLPGIELPPLGLPAHSQSIYRLRYRVRDGIQLHGNAMISYDFKLCQEILSYVSRIS
jgi:hypothetical protein